MDLEWNLVDENRMWGAFNFNGGAYYYDRFGDNRNVKKRPHWMGEEFYGELSCHLVLPTFLRILKLKKGNQKSPIGGSLYVDRNVSPGTYQDRMIKY